MQGEVRAGQALPLPREAVGPAAVEAPTPRARARRRALVPYLLLAPTIAFMAIFFAWPMVQALILAVQEGGRFILSPILRMA